MRFRLLRALGACAFVAAVAGAQTPTPAPDTAQAGAVRVFLDCNNRGCDREFFVTELRWANFMRDRLDADVHVIATTLQTGSGGYEYTIVALGQKKFGGRADTLVVVANPNDANDVIRRMLLRTFTQLLLPYAVKGPLASRLTIAYAAPSGGPQTPKDLKDKWNFWTYRIQGNGFFNGEKRQSFRNMFGSVSANRTTNDWKIRVGTNYNYDQSSFTLSTGEEFVNLLRSYGGAASIVKSAGDHWSVGGRAGADYSDFFNYSMNARVAAAVEYDVFPYKEFTRHQLTALYSIGPNAWEYKETTIYGKQREVHPVHTTNFGYTSRQKWGNADVSVFGSQFLDDLKTYSAGVSGFVDVRLGRGLNFNVSGSASRVKDQIYLPRGTLSNEQVIARQQALATNFRYFASMGFSYTFGSIYNTVVNPRMGSLGGGGRNFSFSF